MTTVLLTIIILLVIAQLATTADILKRTARLAIDYRSLITLLDHEGLIIKEPEDMTSN